jgi:trans-2,3-dihydro-3-hydroxyanthranilate isomerase
MRVVRHVITDVFTDRPLTGNALSVFTDARALDDETMQALAREVNLGGTVFVLRSTIPEADARIRIFTPTQEIPFGGHAALGAAFVLAGPLSRDIVRLQTAKGVVPVHVTREGARIVWGWMIQPLPTIEPFSGPSELLGALGAASGVLPAHVYDDGVRHLLVELPTADSVALVRPDMARLAQISSSTVTVFARAGTRWKTRVFAPALGVSEEAASGGAAGALTVHLARHGRIAFGDEIEIDQGGEIGRPSALHGRASGSADKITRVEVGGSAVMVARGEFNVSLTTAAAGPKAAGQRPP